MSNDTLQFYLKMKDMMSGGLVKMGQTAQNTFDKVQSYADKVTRKNKLLGDSYDAIQEKIRKAEAAIRSSNSVAHIRATRQELEKLQRQASNHIGNTGAKSGGGLRGALGGLLPMVGLAGALTLGGSALNMGMQAQARQASFEVIAGKQAGTALNKDLTKYAQDSIYGNEVHTNAQTMLGFGIGAQDVMKNTKMLGDIAMGDANKLQSLTLAFSQVSAAGKLTGQDLLQFINAGFNPLQQMAKDTGKSLAQLKEEVSAGAISFKDVEQAFVSATSAGGMFYNMTNKIAETDFGKWQAFQGQLDGLMTQIGGGLAPAFGELINALSVSLDFVTKHSEWFGILAAAVAGFSIATTIASISWSSLNLAFLASPVGWITAGLMALVAGIVIAWNKFDGFRATVYGLWDAFKQVFTNVGSLFKRIFSPIMEAITAFKEGRYADAAKAIGKQALNLTPVGLAYQTAQFAKEGGFVKGVKDAYKKAYLLEKIRSRTPDQIGAETEAGGGKSGGASTSAAASEAIRGVTSGGPRVININGVKLIENLTMTVGNMDEGLDQLEEKLQNLLLRVLNSGAALQ